MLKVGFGEATHVYSMFGECIEYQLEARRNGLTTITDVNLAPSAEAIVAQAQAKHPNWEAPTIYFGQETAAAAGVRTVMELLKESTDLFLCPSEFVQSDLIENFGVSRARTRLVPYAVNPKWLSIDTKPSPGRVIFVGKAELRKGIHNLCAAANILKEREINCEIYVIGDAPSEIRRQPAAKNLIFRGRLGQEELREAYSTADIFVLPSLAEGSAGVTYEALGAGVPIVTTFEAGSCVTHMQEGIIVQREQPVELANAIEGLILNRDLRNALARNGRKKAQKLSWESYATRLTAALFDEAKDR
nr:glycosyltransferase family 4 protein [uncultured Celeribacter sp.]